MLADRLLHRASVLCAIALVAVLPWPLMLEYGNTSYLAVLAVSLPVWAVLAALQERDDRATFVRIGVIALSVRLVAHLAIFAWATAGGGPYLGPDSTMYFRESHLLAQRGFEISGPPGLFFRSWDCAHFYLFAAARRWLHADLYGLQTLNACLSAFAGPLFFAIWRALGLQHAVLLGVGVAVYPSLVALSVNDLLKDPSILGTATIGVWSLVRLAQSRTAGATVVLASIATLALAYARMSRFYVVAFLEMALLGAMGARWLLLRRSGSVERWAPAIAVITVMALVEGLPMLVGWPSTPRLLVGAVSHTVDTPLMRTYASGLVDYVSRERSPGSEPGDPAIQARAVPDDGRAARVIDGGVTISEPPIAAPASPAALSRPANETSVSLPGRLVRMAVNAVRKLLGPFPWVGPPAWTPRVMLLGDYLLFPGMLIWYAVFPVAVIGIVVVGWRTVRGDAFPTPVIALAMFSTLLMAQYLALNLSYRQREFMVPFLAGVALVALQHGHVPRTARYAYGAYWLLLVTMAVAHLVVRAAMG